MMSNELFLDINAPLPVAIGAAAKVDLSQTSILLIYKQIEQIKDLTELESFMINCEHLNNCYYLLRALVIHAIYENKWYKWKNCSSIYTFCESRDKGVFSLDRTTVQSDLNLANRLQRVLGGSYTDSLRDYLNEYGDKTNRGFKNGAGIFVGFKLIDFADHLIKLESLNRLLDQGYERVCWIDWNSFFSLESKEYRKYVDGIIEDLEMLDAKDILAGDGPINQKIIPYNVPKDLFENEARGMPIKAQDVLARAYNHDASGYKLNLDRLNQMPLKERAAELKAITTAARPIHAKLFKRKSNFAPPFGVLRKERLFNETRPFDDPDLPAKALKYFFSRMPHSSSD
jgi:hypothetical protein